MVVKRRARCRVDGRPEPGPWRPPSRRAWPSRGIYSSFKMEAGFVLLEDLVVPQALRLVEI